METTGQYQYDAPVMKDDPIDEMERAVILVDKRTAELRAELQEAQQRIVALELDRETLKAKLRETAAALRKIVSQE